MVWLSRPYHFKFFKGCLPTALVTFAEKAVIGELHFLCSVTVVYNTLKDCSKKFLFWIFVLKKLFEKFFHFLLVFGLTKET